jgi:hypothetical protein
LWSAAISAASLLTIDDDAPEYVDRAAEYIDRAVLLHSCSILVNSIGCR